MDIDKNFKAIGQEIVEVIKDKLLLKYNEEFEVFKIGRRYGTVGNDSVTAYCRSIKNKDLLFKAVLNSDKVHFKDDYYLSLVCFELQKEIQNAFQENNIEVYPRVTIIGLYECKKKTKLADFIKKENKFNFFIQLYVKDKVKLTNIKKSIELIKDKYPSINMRGNILLLDGENYDKYVKVFKEICDSEDYSVDLSNIIEKYRIERI